MAQLASGQVKVTALRVVEIQDLLGRATVEIDSGNVARILEGQVVMVTGAGGSIGSELCRQVAMFGPEKLLLVERSEPHLFAIEQELLGSSHGINDHSIGCRCSRYLANASASSGVLHQTSSSTPLLTSTFR